MSRMSRRAAMVAAMAALAGPALPPIERTPRRAKAARRMIEIADRMIARHQDRPEDAFLVRVGQDIRAHFVQQFDA